MIHRTSGEGAGYLFYSALQLPLASQRFVLKCKQPAFDKGSLDNGNTLMDETLIQSHTVNSDILG